MGFDDILFDYEVKKEIIEALKPLIGQYDYEDWDDLEGMEEGDKVYCAYSLIYRQLYNLSQVFFAGSMGPSTPSDEMVARNKLMTRKEALQLMYDNQNDDDESDEEEGPILKLLLDTKGQIDVIEEKIRSMRTEYKQ